MVSDLFLWSLLVAAALLKSCAAFDFPYIKGDMVEIKTVEDPQRSEIVYNFQKRLGLGDKDVLPIFCKNDGKQLELHDLATDIGQNVYKLIFVTYDDPALNGNEKTLPFIIGNSMQYKDLKPHIAARFNKKYGKRDKYVKLEDRRIAFSGILKENVNIPVGRTCQIDPHNQTSAKFKLETHTKCRLIVTPKFEALKKPVELSLVTGESVYVKLPGDSYSLEIPNVDIKKDIAYFRSMFEAVKGLDSKTPYLYAICAPDGKEAEDKEILEKVLQRDRTISSKFVTFVDWTSGKNKSEKVTICDQTTYIKAIKRGLPDAYKLVTVEQSSVPAVFKLTKEEAENKKDHALYVQAPLHLNDVVAPLANGEVYYLMKLDSALLRLSGSTIYVPDGEKTTFHKVRSLMEDNLGHTKAWLYPFCLNGKEIDPGMVLKTTIGDQTFLQRLMDPKRNTEALSKNVAVIFSGNPKESKEYGFQLCTDSTFEDLAIRVMGLLKLNADQTLKFFSIRGNSIHNLNDNDRVHDPAARGSDEKIVATVNMANLPTITLNKPFLARYLSLSDPFKARLTGGGIGLTVEQIDPKTTIGSFRKQLMESNNKDVDVDKIRSFPFCVPEIGISDPDKAGLEMDDERTFASYGVSGASGADIIFSYQVGWVSDWLSGDKEVKTVVGICPKSTYEQVVRRAIDPEKSSLRVRIVVEDVKPAKGDSRQRRSFDVSGKRKVDCELVCSDPPSPKNDQSAIYVLPEKFAIVRIRNNMIPIGDPNTTPVKVLRDYFVNKDGNKAWKYAFCAPAGWMFWLGKEMDENKSFAYYGFTFGGEFNLSETETVKVQLEGWDEGEVSMEYCAKSTVRDLKRRLQRFTKADPSAEIHLSGGGFGFLPYLMWSRTGDASFMPSNMIAKIVSYDRPISFADLTPTNKQKPMALLKSTITPESPGGGGGGGSPLGGDDPQKNNVPPLRKLLESELSDPDVIVFTHELTDNAPTK